VVDHDAAVADEDLLDGIGSGGSGEVFDGHGDLRSVFRMVPASGQGVKPRSLAPMRDSGAAFASAVSRRG
jgi:hypothetical protein